MATKIGGWRRRSPDGAVTVTSDALIIDFEPEVQIAEAMRDAIADNLRTSSVPVKSSKPRLGGYGYATGRLADGLRTVAAGNDVWHTDAPPDRLDPATFGARYPEFRAKLAGIIGDPWAKIGERVKRAVDAMSKVVR